MDEKLPRYDRILGDLRSAYDVGAADRDRAEPAPWKLGVRQRFLDTLRDEGAATLLEIGAGTGKDSRFFLDSGLDVVATDLSAEMVRLCRDKGLSAHVMDFMGLNFPSASFDAVYAFNCLLHVPSADFIPVLMHIRGVMKPGGLLFLGQWGDVDYEGVPDWDRHDPPRFFCEYTDQRIQELVSRVFELVEFTPVNVDAADEPHVRFQAMTLRKGPDV